MRCLWPLTSSSPPTLTSIFLSAGRPSRFLQSALSIGRNMDPSNPFGMKCSFSLGTPRASIEPMSSFITLITASEAIHVSTNCGSFVSMAFFSVRDVCSVTTTGTLCFIFSLTAAAPEGHVKWAWMMSNSMPSRLISRSIALAMRYVNPPLNTLRNSGTFTYPRKWTWTLPKE